MCWTKRTYNTKLDELASLKAEKAILDAKVKALEDSIKADLGDLELMDTGRYTVRYTTYESSRFDSKSFGKVHPKLLEQFTKVSTARRFSFTASA